MGELLTAFENLGDTPEFGLVQRRAGAEPVGLLRFATIALPLEARLERLVEALDRGFADLGNPPETITVELAGESGCRTYVARETTFGLLHESHIPEGQIDPALLQRRESARLSMLSRKMLDDLAAAKKLWVWRSSVPTARERVAPLLNVLRRYGRNTLLWVVEADATHPAGSVECLEPDFIKGYIAAPAADTAAFNIHLDSWHAVCRKTVALCSSAADAAVATPQPTALESLWWNPPNPAPPMDCRRLLERLAAIGFPLAGRRTTVEPAARIKSPQFQARYPDVHNLDLIHHQARGGMEHSWRRSVFEERDIEIFQIRGAFICEECLVFDDRLQVIANASDAYSDDTVNRALANILKNAEECMLPHFSGPSVVAKRPGTDNYGHFLMECLPMAVIGGAVCGERDPRYQLYRARPPIVDVMLRSFRMLGATPDRLEIRDYDEPAHCEELIVVRGLTQHGSYMSPLSVGAAAKLAADVTPWPHKKLFVRRVPGWRGNRSLANEDQVAGRLQPLGFHVIEPGQLTFEQQIAAFSGAEQVVGVGGAAMTNIVFCRPGTRIVNLVSAHFPDTFFWFIATHKGLRYSELRGAALAGDRLDVTADFQLGEADITWLETLLRSSDTPQAAAQRAHVQHVGDVESELGQWIGDRGTRRWIEGFSIELMQPNSSIQYRALLGARWLSPWMRDGAFCGTRGVDLPIYGLSVRLAGDLAKSHGCLCSATFTDGSRRDAVPSGEICAADSLAPLEAFKIELREHAPGVA